MSSILYEKLQINFLGFIIFQYICILTNLKLGIMKYILFGIGILTWIAFAYDIEIL